MLVWLHHLYDDVIQLLKNSYGMKKAARKRLVISLAWSKVLPPLKNLGFYHPIHNYDYTLLSVQVKEIASLKKR